MSLLSLSLYLLPLGALALSRPLTQSSPTPTATPNRHSFLEAHPIFLASISCLASHCTSDPVSMTSDKTPADQSLYLANLGRQLDALLEVSHLNIARYDTMAVELSQAKAQLEREKRLEGKKSKGQSSQWTWSDTLQTQVDGAQGRLEEVEATLKETERTLRKLACQLKNALEEERQYQEKKREMEDSSESTPKQRTLSLRPEGKESASDDDDVWAFI